MASSDGKSYPTTPPKSSSHDKYQVRSKEYSLPAHSQQNNISHSSSTCSSTADGSHSPSSAEQAPQIPSAYVGSKTKLVASPDGRSVQLAPEPPRYFSHKKAQVADSTTKSPIFRNDVRSEWIDAMFGPDFFPPSSLVEGNDQGASSSTSSSDSSYYVPPRQGMGLAKIPSFLSYDAVIPSQPKGPTGATKDKKVGVTLSRIPIGVYVRMVDINSEAYCAGIIPGSVLVDINGMGVLGEPSHKLLERLWTYEANSNFIKSGSDSSCISKLKNTMNENDTSRKHATESSSDGGGVGEPISMKLIKDGQLYTVVLFSSSPFGISWAPCANFALVQRTYSFAQKAGVRRGCIVAAVNGRSLRQMDHLDTAMELKERFMASDEIRVCCAFTPAASRSGFHERGAQVEVSSNGRTAVGDVKIVDGVRVRRVVESTKKKKKKSLEKPLEYGVGSFFTCGGSNSYTPSESTIDSQSDSNIVSEFANRVAAGEVAAPTGGKYGVLSTLNPNNDRKNSSQSLSTPSQLKGSSSIISLSGPEGLPKNYPPSDKSELLTRWNSLDAIVFSLRMRAAGYDEERFASMGGVIGVPGKKTGLVSLQNGSTSTSEESNSIALHSRHANVKLIKSILLEEKSSEVYSAFLLQLVAFVASKELFNEIVEEAVGFPDGEGSQLDGEPQSQSEEVLAKNKMIVEAAIAEAECLCEEIMESIVDAAMQDDQLCQLLHFLLRSFSSTLAKQEEEENSGFSPLKLLASSHLQLRNTLLERDAMNAAALVDNVKLPSPSPKATGNNMNDFDNRPEVREYKESPKQQQTKSKKGKKLVKLFRSRGSKSKKNSAKEVPAVTTEDSLKSVSISLSSDSNLSKAASFVKVSSPRKIEPMPNSILRKAADQSDRQIETQNNSLVSQTPSIPVLFEKMGWFLSRLDYLCVNIEQSLLKSFSQKLTEWALQPWSPNKNKALEDGTIDMRNGLKTINNVGKADGEKSDEWSPVINPVNSQELLVSLVPHESYILPSAHFPLLLTFEAQQYEESSGVSSHEISMGTMYRTRIEVLALRSESVDNNGNEKKEDSYVVHAAVAGNVQETERSALEPYYGSTTHRWHNKNIMEFNTKGCTAPKTISLRLSSTSFEKTGTHKVAHHDEGGMVHYSAEVGCAWVDISGLWDNNSDSDTSKTFQTKILSFDSQHDFDSDGKLPSDLNQTPQKLSLELQVATEAIPLNNRANLQPTRRLLYKHDDDMRQEMLAIQFLETCDNLLRLSGLDLKLKKYKCIPVGEKRGFVEWVDGTVSLSELCKPTGKSLHSKESKQFPSPSDDMEVKSFDGGDTSKEFIRSGGWCNFDTLRNLRHEQRSASKHGIGLSGNNPVQDFLRSNAYDADAPYMIRKDVMDNYVRSCAGYCVITYLLGVGDRHTDNLLLHSDGHFLHCDYSFILGQDPKTYLPMRITEHMVNGMGGHDSDNFAMFLSFAGAAFVSLRQHSSVRILLSLVRSMLHSQIPDISINQSPETAISSMLERFRLDLNDDEAVYFIEENIERSIVSKMWIAVDAMHSFAKHF